MGNRLSKIYTRTGDDGTTGLGDGSRTVKESLRVEAYGTVDEANSAIGIVLATTNLPEAARACLTDVQHDLFDLGAELCVPGYRVVRVETVAPEVPRYLNRLSDLLFVLARVLARHEQGSEVLWKRGRK